MIWQPEFTDKTLSRKPGAVQVQALALVDIRVPDHLIVGGNQVFSFAEHGLL